jgi:hypothetical protein
MPKEQMKTTVSVAAITLKGLLLMKIPKLEKNEVKKCKDLNIRFLCFNFGCFLNSFYPALLQYISNKQPLIKLIVYLRDLVLSH